MADEIDVDRGEGWSVSSLDRLGEGYGFRKIRSGMGVEAFGVNGIVMPAGYDTGAHLHETQEELYIVLDGEFEITLDGETRRLGPGGLAWVDAPVHRSVKNVGEGDGTYIVVGGKGGYVGRDGIDPGSMGVAAPAWSWRARWAEVKAARGNEAGHWADLFPYSGPNPAHWRFRPEAGWSGMDIYGPFQTRERRSTSTAAVAGSL